MAGGETQLTGPDLREGVPTSAVAEGESLLGHADGAPVLLVNVGSDVFAVDANCTHYGGPLSDGVVVGDTVRCPWHHACFSVRTGEVLQPPALGDLSRWNVTVRDGIVRVTGKAAAYTPGRTPAEAPESVVIAGAGAAGASAAETLRREGYEGPILLIDSEQDSPYDRPNLSKDYLAGTAPEEWIPLHPPQFWAGKGIDLIRATVSEIDTERSLVELGDGSLRSYGALILATGAAPIVLPIPVEDGGRLFTLRSLADSRAIISAAQTATRAVVIGASFIGLEAAAALRRRGLDVHVIAPEEVPLARVMGPDLGVFVRRLHEEHGVVFHLGHTVRSVAPDHVITDDGERIEADFVVAGVGVKPRVELARAAGLDVDDGIVVNEFLETSASGVWAAGDAARWPDPRLGRLVRVEHWVLAQRMGQAAARNVLGARVPFHAAPFFWSQHYDVAIAYVGHAPDWDVAKLDGNPAERDCAVTFMKEGRRLAVATISRDRISLRAEVELEADTAASG